MMTRQVLTAKDISENLQYNPRAKSYQVNSATQMKELKKSRTNLTFRGRVKQALSSMKKM